MKSFIITQLCHRFSIVTKQKLKYNMKTTTQTHFEIWAPRKNESTKLQKRNKKTKPLIHWEFTPLHTPPPHPTPCNPDMSRLRNNDSSSREEDDTLRSETGGAHTRCLRGCLRWQKWHPSTPPTFEGRGPPVLPAWKAGQKQFPSPADAARPPRPPPQQNPRQSQPGGTAAGVGRAGGSGTRVGRAGRGDGGGGQALGGWVGSASVHTHTHTPRRPLGGSRTQPSPLPRGCGTQPTPALSPSPPFLLSLPFFFLCPVPPPPPPRQETGHSLAIQGLA